MSQYAVFTVGSETFGVDILRVVEILNPLRIFTIPDMPPFLSGVINLRGMVIPIIDLRERFGMESRPVRERIIIVRVEGQKVGLHVDSVVDIMDFDSGEITPPPPIFRGFKPEYLVGLARKDEKVIILLNTDAVLTAREKQLLMKSRKRMEASLAGETSGTAEKQ